MRLEKIGFGIIALVCVAYFIARSVEIPLTHDEGATYFSSVPRNVVALFMYEDPIPNNHILNTLAIKISKATFGASLWSVRLPAILGGVCYLIGAIGIAFAVGKDTWVRLLTLVALLGNPFLLEFFALARGYGIGCGLAVLSIWQTLLFFETQSDKNLQRAAIFGGLAVLASFTVLNYYLPFFGFLLAYLLQRDGWKGIFGKQFRILMVVSMALALLCYTPLKRMSETDQFHFWSSASFYKDTVVTFLRTGLLAKEPFGQNTYPVIAGFFGLIWLVWGGVSIHQWWKNNKSLRDARLFAWVMFTGTVLMTILQKSFFNIPYLSGRTALIFWPLLALGFPFCVEWLRKNRSSSVRMASIVLIALFSWNTLSSVNRQYSYEWWFDRDTFKVMKYLKDVHTKENRTEKIILHTGWLYYSSLNFEAETRYADYVAPMPWVDKPDPNGSAEFYYVSVEDLPNFESNYDTALVVEPNQRFLLRKKAN